MLLVESQGRMLVGPGFKLEQTTVTRARFAFKCGQDSCGGSLRAAGWADKHALDLSSPALKHHRATTDGNAVAVSCNGEQHVLLLQAHQVECVPSLGGIQRVLKRIELSNQLDDRCLSWRLKLNMHRHVVLCPTLDMRRGQRRHNRWQRARLLFAVRCRRDAGLRHRHTKKHERR